MLRASRCILRQALVLFVMIMLSSRASFGYRPFDGTDAAVAPVGVVELEVGPTGYLRQGASTYLIAPALIANYGIVDDFELVAEGKYATRLVDTGREVRSQLVESAFSLKQVVRTGVLQGRPGLSIANEWSVLFPDTSSDQRVGGQLTTIFSQTLSMLTLHLNIVNEFSRTRHYVVWIDPIIEGPGRWGARPVVELLATREFGSARLRQGLAGSVLFGVIANATDALAVDGALRMEKSAGVLVREIRAGFTCDF